MNKSVTTGIAVTIAAGLTILSGLWHGTISHRWQATPSLLDAVASLESLPQEFGVWKAEHSFELDPEVGAILQCSGYVHRRYVNQENGQSVQVFVVLGPPGPISVHTPEVCYSGAGYSTQSETKTMTIEGSDGSRDQFHWVNLQRDEDASSRLTVGYGWTTGDQFVAPDSPRWTFRNAPYLYKIQWAAHHTPSTTASPRESSPDDPEVFQSFVRDLLPVLRPCLSRPSS